MAAGAGVEDAGALLGVGVPDARRCTPATEGVEAVGVVETAGVVRGVSGVVTERDCTTESDDAPAGSDALRALSSISSGAVRDGSTTALSREGAVGVTLGAVRRGVLISA